MRHDETAVVQNVMTDETVDEVSNVFLQLGWLLVQLFERLGETVCDLNVATAQLAHQLRVVISRDGERVARLRHVHDELQHFRNLWTTIDEVAEKDCLASFGMAAFELRRDLVPEVREERVQLVEAAVNVADDVEWSVIEFAVVPEWLSL